MLVTSCSSLSFDSSPFLLRGDPVDALSVFFLFLGSKLWLILIGFYWGGGGEKGREKREEKNTPESIFSCHHVGSKDQTQLIRLDYTCLYLLSHPGNPDYFKLREDRWKNKDSDLSLKETSTPQTHLLWPDVLSLMLPNSRLQSCDGISRGRVKGWETGYLFLYL